MNKTSKVIWYMAYALDNKKLFWLFNSFGSKYFTLFGIFFVVLKLIVFLTMQIVYDCYYCYCIFVASLFIESLLSFSLLSSGHLSEN